MKQWNYYVKFAIVFLFVWILMAVGIRQVSRNIILGADYYTFYTAARMYLLDRINPYSQEVTQAAQLGILGRLAAPQEDQLAFAYPFFMLFWVFPFAWQDISISQPLWMSLNILLTLTCLIKIFQNKKFFALLGLTFYPILFGIILGNFSNLICLIVLYYFDQVFFNQPARNRQILLGFLLSWLIGKPQLTTLVLVFAVLICFHMKYLPQVFSFGISLIFLLIVSALLLPNWLDLWIQQIQQYSVYNQAKPAILAQYLLSFTNIPEKLILGIMIIAVMAVFTGWFLVVHKSENLHNQEKKFRNLLLLNLIILLTSLLIPRTLSYDHTLILVGFFLGSKFLIELNCKYQWIALIWLFYSAISWLTSINITFPIIISTSWLIIFWFLSKDKMKETSHELA